MVYYEEVKALALLIEFLWWVAEKVARPTFFRITRQFDSGTRTPGLIRTGDQLFDAPGSPKDGRHRNTVWGVGSDPPHFILRTNGSIVSREAVFESSLRDLSKSCLIL